MDDQLLEQYRNEASRINEDAIHSAKGHYNAADRWRHAHLWIGLPNALLAGVAGVSAFNGSELIAGILSVSVAAIAAMNTFLNPGDRNSTHKRCAAEYHALRNKARIFENITSRQNITLDDLGTKFEELLLKRDDLNATSPQIPYWAFQKAKEGIDSGEAEYKK